MQVQIPGDCMFLLTVSSMSGYCGGGGTGNKAERVHLDP